jgi:2-polyprenyl-3-methyl-5-hydroxy-6-metoxy-1,4-benzoquinol methylase
MDAPVGVGIEVPGHYRSDKRAEVRALLPRLKSGLKVLEIGCGEGNFCLSLPEVAEAWGIEPHEASARVAAGQLHRVFASTFEQARAELPHRYFDLVVCNDVIEHMTDAAWFLKAVSAHMAPGSHLVGSVPNVRFSSNLFNLIVARDWHYQNAGILDRTHFRFFTMRSMRRTLEEAGFRVVRLEGLNKGAVSGWSIRAVLERLFRLVLLLASAGAARDIAYLQIGFLAAPPLLAGSEQAAP